METVKVGMREFREKLAGYLESDTPLAIMRHGQTLGYYIPAQKRSRKAELEAMRAAAKDLDKMIASWSATEDEVHVGLLLAVPVLFPDERWVAEQVVAPIWRKHRVPVDPQRVVDGDVRGVCDRKAGIVLAELR